MELYHQLIRTKYYLRFNKEFEEPEVFEGFEIIKYIEDYYENYKQQYKHF